MRTFELCTLAALFLSLAGYCLSPHQRPRWMGLLPSLAVVLTAIHLVWEKYRWQMVPAYGLTLLLFLLSLPRIRRSGRPAERRPSRRAVRIIRSLFGLGVFSFAAALPALFPVFRLPQPTGPHPVGTTKLHLVDRTRSEPYTLDPDDYREFMAQVWYPAWVEPDARPAVYMEHMPGLFSHLSRLRTQTIQDAPVSEVQSAYPVLIFSHGYVGYAEQNLPLMEELASHGYIVCSIAHTYNAMVTVFPDGRIVPADPVLMNRYLDGSLATRDKSQDLDTWINDTLFLIDTLESFQAGESDSIFAGKLDLARLGIFGVSFGGTTAIRVCALDDRCQAGINLDGGSPMASSLGQPFMFMVNADRGIYVTRTLNDMETTAYGVVIRGTKHLDFSDLGLYSPVFKFADVLGSIGGRRMAKILNAYTLAFFDRHLKGESVPLLDGPSPDHPEIVFQSHIP